MMLLRKKLWQTVLVNSSLYSAYTRFYSSNVNFNKLRPMIHKRIENRAKDYPVPSMVPVAQEVLHARLSLIQGVSTLIKVFPVLACKFCPEVYVGEEGHLIQTCPGYRRRGKSGIHEWVPGDLKDILVPVETFQLNKMFQEVIRHDDRFDYDRVPAVVELCRQAGADLKEYEHLDKEVGLDGMDGATTTKSLSPYELMSVANLTLNAWETLRLGIERLLMVYPAKVCEYCSEVHVGPSGHKARLCGVFKFQSWRGSHFWKKAGVDNLVPPKIVWRRRPQDPPVLVNKGRDFYGHAPAVVDICTKAGIIAPAKYFCIMKFQGASTPYKSVAPELENKKQ